MKKLIYISSLVCLFSCIDRSNITQLRTKLKGKIDKISLDAYQQVRGYVEKELQDFKTGEIELRPELFFERFRYIKKLEKGYLWALDALEKGNTNTEYQAVYKKHHQLLVKELQKNPELWERVESYLQTPKNLSIALKPNPRLLKDVIKLRISENYAYVFERLFADDLSACLWFNKMGLMGNNKSQKVEIGEDITLSTFLIFSGNTPHKKYDYNFSIDKGSIDSKYRGIFNISITAQKLGKQGFEVILELQEWGNDKDSTLYFTENFEVIE